MTRKVLRRTHHLLGPLQKEVKLPKIVSGRACYLTKLIYERVRFSKFRIIASGARGTVISGTAVKYVMIRISTIYGMPY
jgi:hypothetical protein